jgi:hypothetical protein
MLQQWACGTNAQATLGEYDNEIPNTEPTDTRTGQKGGQHYDKPYTNWKSKYYSTSRERNVGLGNGEGAPQSVSEKTDGTSVFADTTNKWYNLYAMVRFRKILKRYSKYNQTNMSA